MQFGPASCQHTTRPQIGAQQSQLRDTAETGTNSRSVTWIETRRTTTDGRFRTPTRQPLALTTHLGQSGPLDKDNLSGTQKRQPDFARPHQDTTRQTNDDFYLGARTVCARVRARGTQRDGGDRE